jgi:hypothetical protein
VIFCNWFQQYIAPQYGRKRGAKWKAPGKRGIRGNWKTRYNSELERYCGTGAALHF